MRFASTLLSAEIRAPGCREYAIGQKKFEASGASELRLGWNGEAAGEPHTWQPIDCSGIFHRGHCSPEITLVPIIKQLII